MADHFDVVTDDLRAHAGNIDAIRERFAAVLGAINSVSQDDEAYGIICQFLPPILADRQEEQKELTAMAQENLELLAEAVRATAEDYEAADEASAREHRGIHDQI
ncbi:ESX-1 secretion-associated protein [Glycomyces sp. A-F 0318]|uniref:type VII secretion target n=1 Tax=Glycomyces amatae TaxID=2881355 RepID=UPI001E3813E7|nr:type VII secretion target [Glycomyces amatae]MCD0442265.1 ESX-1 secretion-associated protein [Glycomyces amatae]